MMAMLGWFSDARVLASRSNRARRSASCANASGSTLIATSRPRFLSVARYTSPIPPAPSGTPMVYAPRRVPGVSGMMKPILCATGCSADQLHDLADRIDVDEIQVEESQRDHEDDHAKYW